MVVKKDSGEFGVFSKTGFIFYILIMAFGGGGFTLYILWVSVNKIAILLSPPVDQPVHECLEAIQNRDWDSYRNSFEPSAVIYPQSPGIPGKFAPPMIRVRQKNERSAVVYVSSSWAPSMSTQSIPIEIGLQLVKLERTDWLGHLGLKRWYIAADDASVLPFNGRLSE